MRPIFLLSGALAICALLGEHGTVSAAPGALLMDPTRPPSLAPEVAGGEAGARNRTVQSVLIAPGRSVAVIDGQMVKVGSRLGDARVVKIDASGVVLSSGGRTETLKLLPDAKKMGSRASRKNANEERLK